MCEIARYYPAASSVEAATAPSRWDGSRAKGTHKFGSDIDLAIMSAGVSDKTIRNIKAEIEESSLPYFVDITNFTTLNHKELAEHIQRVGVPLLQI